MKRGDLKGDKMGVESDFSEDVFKEILRNVCASLNEPYPSDKQGSNFSNCVRDCYKAVFESVLESMPWSFATKKTKIVRYEDELGGYHIPSGYVKFLNLGTSYGCCDACSYGKQGFTLYMSDGRLYPSSTICCEYSCHDFIYYICSDFPLSQVKGGFIELVSHDLILKLGAQRGLSEASLQLFSRTRDRIAQTAIATGGAEFQHSQNTRKDFSVRNSFGTRDNSFKGF